MQLDCPAGLTSLHIEVKTSYSIEKHVFSHCSRRQFHASKTWKNYKKTETQRGALASDPATDTERPSSSLPQGQTAAEATEACGDTAGKTSRKYENRDTGEAGCVFWGVFFTVNCKRAGEHRASAGAQRRWETHQQHCHPRFLAGRQMQARAGQSLERFQKDG